MDPQISRRQLLLAGAGLALTSACSRERRVVKGGDTTQPASSRANIVMASFLPLVGQDQRLAFAVIDGEQEPLRVPEVEVSVARDGDGMRASTYTAKLHKDGVETRPYYLVQGDFDTPGRWALNLTGGRSGEAFFEVFEPGSLEQPTPGEPMVSVPTPTTTDGRGVTPICSREPHCPFHSTSLDQALTQGKPVVALFATPALCQSATCGPVLDILMGLSGAYQDKVTFVHVEIFTDLSGKTLAPAVQAYKLKNEPVLFVADKTGQVTEMFDGVFDRVEAEGFLKRAAG